MLQLHIGYDPREADAFRVAADTAARLSRHPVAVRALDAAELYRDRLLWRPVEHEGGVEIDHLSGAPQSTRFANARFLVPFIQRTGWALFVDCDVVFLADVAELFAHADPRYAVMCVQHRHEPAQGVKMVSQPQTAYSRKNWSSVMLWNLAHPAHHRLTLAQVNQYPGDLLHRLFWLRDAEIGALPAEWNWLVGVQPRPLTPKIAHFTLGGPWLPGWKGAEHDEIWNDAWQSANRRSP